MDGPPEAADPRGTLPRMILRLDPRYPMVWRNPSSVQLGVDPALVVLDELTPTEERMLAALMVGVSEPGLTMIARGLEPERERLLARLAPVLAAPEAPTALPTVAISGGDAMVAAITSALAGGGVRTVVGSSPSDLADARPDLAIATGHFVLDPALHGFWLRRDVPHLPVVLSDTGVTIGPLIEPGSGPCLLCLELHRRDADPAWPAVATQLLGRRSQAGSSVLLAEAAGVVGRIVMGRLFEGPGARASLRIDAATGARTTRTWLAHPECGCRGIDRLVEPVPLSPGRRETGSVAAARRATAVRSRTS